MFSRWFVYAYCDAICGAVICDLHEIVGEMGEEFNDVVRMYSLKWKGLDVILVKANSLQLDWDCLVVWRFQWLLEPSSKSKIWQKRLSCIWCVNMLGLDSRKCQPQNHDFSTCLNSHNLLKITWNQIVNKKHYRWQQTLSKLHFVWEKMKISVHYSL